MYLNITTPFNHLNSLTALSGHVHLATADAIPLTSITVTLIGTSSTTIPNPIKPNAKPLKDEHIFLHESIRVWDFYRGNANMLGHYTLAPGEYSWPFTFHPTEGMKCGKVGKGKLSLSSLFGKARTHVTGSFPPSCAIEGLAEVRYYLTAKMVTKDVFSTDPVAWQEVYYVPALPPQQYNSGGLETVAQQECTVIQEMENADVEKKTVPNVWVEARLQGPPGGLQRLRISFSKLRQEDGGEELLYLHRVRVRTVELTKATAQGVEKVTEVEISACDVPLLTSPAVLEDSNNDSGQGTSREQGLRRVLGGFEECKVFTLEDFCANPSGVHVTPNFETCNIHRFYEVEIATTISVTEKPLNEWFTNTTLRLPCEAIVSHLADTRPPAEVQQSIASSVVEEKQKWNEHSREPPKYEDVAMNAECSSSPNVKA
ncbi:MAG: hypothetical protein Q9162_006073 [Coniocarpon cinnabarinum]